MDRIDIFLEKQRQEGKYRILQPLVYRKSGRICVKGKEFYDFSSNDYLGLAEHPSLKEAAKKAIDEFGTSSSASRLLSGDFEFHHRLEAKVANFQNKESALIFNSGYQANIGIISALCGRDDVIFADKLSHASIIDGILLSGAKFFRFKHNDINHLEDFLKKERKKYKTALIITESVFSMTGDKARITEIVNLKEKYDCKIMIDEAHAVGIFGENGAGLIEETRLSDKVDLIMGTFGKALGSFGAYLACSNEIKDYLVNTCRSFIYSTALPPAVIMANLISLELVKNEPWRRKTLLENAYTFRNNLIKKNLQVNGSSQIISLVVGDSFKAVKFSRLLQENGYWVLPIRPPTVPEGQSLLRFSLSYNHSKDLLNKLADDISKSIPKLN